MDVPHFVTGHFGTRFGCSSDSFHRLDAFCHHRMQIGGERTVVDVMDPKVLVPLSEQLVRY